MKHFDYLVVVNHSMDDLPVRLFKTKQAAVKYARRRSGWPSEAERQIFSTDCSTPCGIAVVTFCDGKPVDYEYVKDTSEETED